MSEIPAVAYPPELPVSQRRDDIVAALRAHQVLIVAGATGSGKTTQLPKMLLELGKESIGHTQPRRIAARTIAERVAEELGRPELVGYKVRFTDTIGPQARIKLMTDGVLLNEIHRDRDLRAYDAIIIDEAHERSLTVDFLLGYLKQLLPRRPDLTVVITSATIDPESFARHFAAADGTPAPIIEVSGRTYPVEIRYRPLVAESRSTPERRSSSPEGVSRPDGDGFDTPTSSATQPAGRGGFDTPTSSATQPAGRGGFDTPTTSATQPAGAPAAAADRDPIEGVVAAVEELSREEPGDVLVFLSGEAEIRDAEDALRGWASRRPGAPTEVLPLYGRLSAADQHRVFEPKPGGARRIVLATNVAETSLTVPGIRYVVDAGTARISRYSVRSKIQRLPIEAISQASANQRSGRAGRTSPGIAIRLYSEDDFARRPEFTEPEILRTNLAAVILQMISLGLGDIQAFPFLQAPDSRGVKDGLELLTELGAVETAPSRSSSRKGVASAGSTGGFDTPTTSATQPAGDSRGGFDTPTKSATQPAGGFDTPTTSATQPAAGATPAAGPRITRVGRQLAQLPIDPRLARMVVESGRHGTTREVIVIVAGLSIQDPRERPLERRAHADQLHARFTDPTSDFLTLLNLWNHLEEQRTQLSGNQFRRLCKAEYLNFLRVREWQDVVRQLTRAVKGMKLGDGTAANAADGIHQSLLAGLLSHMGLRDLAKKDYLGARQTRFVIFPGSALAKKQPAAIMSAELVETSRLFARMNAAIDPAWAEEIAGDLVKRSHSEPRWEKRQGSVVADERVTLYGLPIVAKRRVQFARIDPEYAHELFVRHALVAGEWDVSRLDKRLTAFLRDNRALRTRLAELEDMTRRRDILVDDEAVVDFYRERVPVEVSSTRAFERWWRGERATNPDLLTMTESDLLDEEETEPVAELYPRQWQQGDQRLALAYRFEPGAADDGVSVRIPVALLHGLSSDGFDWQVPGLREELVTALIKTLPKHIRREVVPAADWARKLLSAIEPGVSTGGVISTSSISEGGSISSASSTGAGGSITEALAAEIRAQTHAVVTAADFDLERLPAHLRPTFTVVGERGRVLGSGKSLPALQLALQAPVRESVAKATATTPARNDLERSGLTSWDFDALPRTIDTRHAGGTVRAWPSLVDMGSSVDVRLQSTEDAQRAVHRAGVRRLLLLAIPSPLPYVQEHLTAQEKLALAASPYRSNSDLFEDCMTACIDAVVDTSAIFTREEFERARDAVSAILVDSLFQAVALVAQVLGKVRAADKAISGASAIHLMALLADAREQLAALVHPGFVGRAGLAQLRRYPAYLDGIVHRVAKLQENPGRDRTWLSEVEEATRLYVSAGGDLPLTDSTPDRVRPVRWMLEELRLGLFAQHLPTSGPVSLQRIRKALAGG